MTQLRHCRWWALPDAAVKAKAEAEAKAKAGPVPKAFYPKNCSVKLHVSSLPVN
jgi:hypothetical protein